MTIDGRMTKQEVLVLWYSYAFYPQWPRKYEYFRKYVTSSRLVFFLHEKRHGVDWTKNNFLIKVLSKHLQKAILNKTVGGIQTIQYTFLYEIIILMLCFILFHFRTNLRLGVWPSKSSYLTLFGATLYISNPIQNPISLPNKLRRK